MSCNGCGLANDGVFDEPQCDCGYERDEEMELAKSWIKEFWNAKESWEFADSRGNSVDIEKTEKRMDHAVQALEDIGYLKPGMKMPTLDEIGA